MYVCLGLAMEFESALNSKAPKMKYSMEWNNLSMLGTLNSGMSSLLIEENKKINAIQITTGVQNQKKLTNFLMGFSFARRAMLAGIGCRRTGRAFTILFSAFSLIICLVKTGAFKYYTAARAPTTAEHSTCFTELSAAR